MDTDYVLVGFAIVFVIAGVLACWVVWVSRRDAAGKSYGPETAMGIGMSDVGRGGTGADAGTGSGMGIGTGSAGGDGSSS